MRSVRRRRGSPGLLQRALAPCDSLDVEQLAKAAVEGQDAIYSYLQKTAYADAVPALQESPSAFERWCDNRIIREIRPQQYNPFTVGPLAAFLLARENEVRRFGSSSPENGTICGRKRSASGCGKCTAMFREGRHV